MSATAGRWTKIHDSLINGRALGLSRDARLLGVEAEAWSDNQETDGFILRRGLGMITDAVDPEALAVELVEGGYWTATDDGWEIIGFTERHMTSEARTESRTESAARIRGSRNHQNGRHTAEGPRYCAECSAERSAVRSGVRTVVDAKREARSAKRSPTSLARSASPSASATGSAPLARPKRVMSEEARTKMSVAAKANAERRRVEKAERAEAERIANEERERARAEAARAADERRAEEQRARDAEWVARGGDPSEVPVSPEQLLKLTNPTAWRARQQRRPLR